MTTQLSFRAKRVLRASALTLRGEISLLLSVAALLLCTPSSSAQVATGTPPFGSFSGSPDVVNLANLNAHLNIPIIHKAGRGIPFNYDLTYDTAVWSPVNASGVSTWTPVGNWGWSDSLFKVGHIAYSQGLTSGTCTGAGGRPGHWSRATYHWTYYDGLGTAHYFTSTSTIYTSTCSSGGPTGFTQICPDGSGYTLTVSGSTVQKLTDAAGSVINAPVNVSYGASTVTDRNGNQISASSAGVYTDTLGTTALTISGGPAPTPLHYQYSAPGANGTGTPVSVVVNYTSYTVATNFGISTITEYGAHNIPLITSIVYPDQSQYAFTYEQTPSVPSSGLCTPLSGTFQGYCVTGRLIGVTLPTGGQVTYAYSDGNNGILSDGSTATLTRTTPDGTWKYTQIKGTGAASATTITAPKLSYDSVSNQTIAQFQGIYETQRDVYQGSAPIISSLPIAESTLQTSNLLLETQTCYNGAALPCSTTAITLPITQRAVSQQYPSGLQNKHVYSYTTYGLLTEQDDYEYKIGTPTTILSKKVLAYASLGNGIVGMPSSVTICNGTGSSASCNGTGTVAAQTIYAYDETALSTPTGTTPQHTSISGSRGNATTIKKLVQGTTFLTSTSTYYDMGLPNTVTDVNGPSSAVTYNFLDANSTCGNTFPTSVSKPLGLSSSMNWNCVGGVMTLLTDENGQNLTATYTDPYFWRPSTRSDQLNNQTSLTYQPNPTYCCPWMVSSQLTFNAGTSVAEDVQYKDGLGRPYVDQHQQSPTGPGSSMLDSVSYTFDTNGRPYTVSLPCTIGYAQTCPTVALTRTYDALNRPKQIADAGGGTVTYSFNQNDVLVTVGPAPSGENAKSRQFEYDALGRLTSVCEITSGTTAWPAASCGQNTAATGYLTKYTYDALGNILTVTQNAQSGSNQQTRSFSLDGLSRLTSETNPESGTTTYTYDTDASCGSSSGDLVKRVDAVGDLICYGRDALHRTTSEVIYNAPNQQGNRYFVYDTGSVNGQTMQNGKTRLIEAFTAGCPTCSKITDVGFSYTARGELSDVYQSTPHSGGYYHLTQSYWANGLPNQLGNNIVSLPALTYSPDGEGRVNSVTDSAPRTLISGTTYTAASLPTQITFGSGDTDIFAYDSNTLRMTQYKFNVGSPAQSLIGNVNWNANGSLASLGITDPFNSADTQNCSYAHDDLSRIASANCGSAANQTFSYDPFGNINKSGSPFSFQPTYSVSTNRMTNISGFTPTYDANGNVLNDNNHTYTWDGVGNSVTVDSVSVTYDALDRAVEQNRSGSYTQIVYAPSGAKLALMNGQTLQKAFASLLGGATAVYVGGNLDHFRHSDWLGSARMTSTPSRTYVSSVAYAPFGETYAQSGTADFSFTGQNSDTSSGDYDFLFREYSTQGRWAAPDPSGLRAASPSLPQKWNRYAYITNTPLSSVDPLGLDGCRIHGVGMKKCEPAAGGSISGGGDCTIDGIEAPCGLITTDSDVQCPGNVCYGVNDLGLPVQFVATMSGSYFACLLAGSWDTQQDAGIAAVGCANGRSIATNRELCGNVFSSNGQYSFTSPTQGTGDTCPFNPGAIPDGSNYGGQYHTHGAFDPQYDSEQFSGIGCNGPGSYCDIGIGMYLNQGQPMFLGTPAGRIEVFYPDQAAALPYGCVLQGSAVSPAPPGSGISAVPVPVCH